MPLSDLFRARIFQKRRRERKRKKEREREATLIYGAIPTAFCSGPAYTKRERRGYDDSNATVFFFFRVVLQV